MCTRTGCFNLLIGLFVSGNGPQRMQVTAQGPTCKSVLFKFDCSSIPYGTTVAFAAISPKAFIKFAYQGQFPHESVNLSLVITYVKTK